MEIPKMVCVKVIPEFALVDCRTLLKETVLVYEKTHIGKHTTKTPRENAVLRNFPPESKGQSPKIREHRKIQLCRTMKPAVCSQLVLQGNSYPDQFQHRLEVILQYTKQPVMLKYYKS